MNVGKFSVRNPNLVNILMLVVLVMGALSASRLPKEQFSEIPFFFVTISIPYPGVAAEDIEKSVTVKVENEMKGLDRLDRVTSITNQGIALVTLEFNQGITKQEFDKLFQQVQNRYSNLDLPDGVLQSTIDEFSTNDFVPVIEVIVSGDVSYGTLNSTAGDLADNLRGIKEVSGVTLVGSRDREVLVDADREKLEAYDISVDQIVRAIRSRNVTIPGGTLATSSRDYLLRTVGDVEQYQTLGGAVVRQTGGERPGVITVGDVAVVRVGYDRTNLAARFNGQTSIALRVSKIPGGSSVGVVEQVKQAVGSYQSKLPAGVKTSFFNDSTVQIQQSINVLLTNAFLGLVLLVIVLFVFVGLRNAVMTGLGIPITFAITFIVLELSGETLNGNSLFGMVLVLGLIVDHAIVIVENSFRLQGEGLSRHDAAIAGVNQVIVPVIAATATTVAAFLPLTFLPGVIGKFLRVVPFTVSVALIASTFEAALFLPSHYADWPGSRKKPKARKYFDIFRERFGRFIEIVYRRRGLALIGALLLLVGGFALVGTVGQDLFAAEDFSYFYIDIEMPPGTPLEATDRTVAAFEERLLPLVGNGEVVNVSSSIGFAASENQNIKKSNVAQIIVDLADRSRGRKRSIARIMADIRERCSAIAGPEDVRYRKAVNGPPVDPPVVFRLFADDYASLTGASTMIKQRLAEYPELFNIKDNLEQGNPELRVQVNDRLAARYGLSRQSVGSFVRASFDGVNAGTIFSNNQETSVVVRYAHPDTFSVADLAQLKVPTPDGRQVPLAAVASIDTGTAFATIKRLDGQREVTVESQAYQSDNLNQINSDIGDFFRIHIAPQYPDVELKVGGQFAEFTNIVFDILRVFLLGIFLIYTILATQFKSYTQPVLILLSVPFAFVGVILFLFVSGTALSTTVIYAGVALAGIAVNDTIVLLSFINEKRRDGTETGEAVIEATKLRLRPILLTSLTTIGGLVPTAIGLGGKSVIWGPMASTIIFGLIFSTVTALVIIPCLYGLFYDRKNRRNVAATY